MPIYEFYCKDCHMIFNFFSSRVNTERRPLCPKCKKIILEKIISNFSVKRGIKEDDILPDIDENKMLKAIGMLEQETKNLKEDDPKAAASLMKKLLDATNLKPGAGMEEVIHRLERGDSLEKIEEEMGDISEEDLIEFNPKIPIKSKKEPPFRDDTLYVL